MEENSEKGSMKKKIIIYLFNLKTPKLLKWRGNQLRVLINQRLKLRIEKEIEEIKEESMDLKEKKGRCE